MRSIGHAAQMTKRESNRPAAAPAPLVSVISPLAKRLARDQAESPIELLAETCFLLAQALWEAPPNRGRDRARAVELAERHLEAFLELGAYGGTDVAEIERWLREHAAPAVVR